MKTPIVSTGLVLLYFGEIGHLNRYASNDPSNYFTAPIFYKTLNLSGSFFDAYRMKNPTLTLYSFTLETHSISPKGIHK